MGIGRKHVFRAHQATLVRGFLFWIMQKQLKRIPKLSQGKQSNKQKTSTAFKLCDFPTVTVTDTPRAENH